MRLHQPGTIDTKVRRAAEKFWMNEIDGADIERRGHPDPALEGDEALDEIEADLAEIETAVDMRRLDIEKALRSDRDRKTGK